MTEKIVTEKKGIEKTTTDKTTDNSDGWRNVDKKLRVNDGQLGPWESAGVDDGIISEFLKRRFLKENDAVLIFQMFFSFTLFIAVIELLMLSDDIALTVVMILITAVMNYIAICNFLKRKERKRILERKQYQVCECRAFEMEDRKDKKLCCVQDENGHVLMVEKEGEKATPMRVPFHCYFSDKDNSCKLLRMRDGQKGMYYIVFPTLYLKAEIGREGRKGRKGRKG